VTQLIERIKATPRQPGVDDIRIPSERAFRCRERALREGNSSVLTWLCNQTGQDLTCHDTVVGRFCRQLEFET
jgi:hypothetical protein